jgi:hypothetical protein
MPSSGSSSCLGNVMVPVPAPVLIPVPVPVPDLDLFSTVFNNRKLAQILPFLCKKQHCFLESWFQFFYTVVVHFMLDSGPNPFPEPEPRARNRNRTTLRFRFWFHEGKSFGSCGYGSGSGFGSTTLHMRCWFPGFKSP